VRTRRALELGEVEPCIAADEAGVSDGASPLNEVFDRRSGGNGVR
jgi:hypothetical protein